MTLNNDLSMLTPLTRFLIGLDHFRDDIEINQYKTESTYPPYNLIKTDKDHYTIELALAGFSPESINVSVENGWLTISSKADTLQNQTGVEDIHRGIARRDFTRKFKLIEHVLVTEAKFKHGILSVNLEYKLPEHLKAKSIAIQTV